MCLKDCQLKTFFCGAANCGNKFSCQSDSLGHSWRCSWQGYRIRPTGMKLLIPPALPTQLPPLPGSLHQSWHHVGHHRLGTKSRTVSDAEPLLHPRLVTPPESLTVKRSHCTGVATTCSWSIEYLPQTFDPLSRPSWLPHCREHIFRLQCCCSSLIRRLWPYCCGPCN